MALNEIVLLVLPAVTLMPRSFPRISLLSMVTLLDPNNNTAVDTLAAGSLGPVSVKLPPMMVLSVIVPPAPTAGFELVLVLV